MRFIYHNKNKKSEKGVKSNNAQPRVTVVGKFENEILSISVARCSKSDPFVKKKGIEIANQRLNQGKVHVVLSCKELTGKRFVNIAKNISNHVENNYMNLNKKDLNFEISNINLIKETNEAI